MSAARKNAADACWVMPLTPAAQYTVEKVRLNRDQLIQIRRSLADEERKKQEELPHILQLAQCLASAGAHGALLNFDCARLAELRSLRAFPLVENG
jgi:hypothetical protein